METKTTPDPVVKTDPAPQPLAAGQDGKQPAEGQDGGGVAAIGNAQNADPNPPVNAEQADAAKKDAGKPDAAPAPAKDGKKDAKKSDEKAAQDDAKKAVKGLPKGSKVMVWVQPGHETLAIGKIIALPGEKAEQVREVGRARYAAEAEIVAAGEDILVLEDL